VRQATRRDPIRRDRRRTSHLVYTATVDNINVCLLATIGWAGRPRQGPRLV